METVQIDEMRVASIEVGYRRLLRKLENLGYQIESIVPINHRRYIIIKGAPCNIMVTYKRELFMNFGKIFRKDGYKGVADTINVLDLKFAIINNVEKIYLIRPNGMVYSISLQTFLEKSVRWENKEGKYVRSVSIHEYQKEMDL